MDAALLLVAANESCPQPQTSEHLAAIEIMRLQHIIILQNKIDLVKESQASQQYKEILNFIQGTGADKSPIIPISAQLGYNIDVLCEYLVKKIPVPKRDFLAPARLIVIRSFDVNRPGTAVEELTGGVAGGSLMQGVLKMGDKIEVRPGVVTTDDAGQFQCSPIYSSIVSLFAEENELQFAVPGGLIGECSACARGRRARVCVCVCVWLTGYCVQVSAPKSIRLCAVLIVWWATSWAPWERFLIYLSRLRSTSFC